MLIPLDFGPHGKSTKELAITKLPEQQRIQILVTRMGKTRDLLRVGT